MWQTDGQTELPWHIHAIAYMLSRVKIDLLALFGPNQWDFRHFYVPFFFRHSTNVLTQLPINLGSLSFDPQEVAEDWGSQPPQVFDASSLEITKVTRKFSGESHIFWLVPSESEALSEVKGSPCKVTTHNTKAIQVFQRGLSKSPNPFEGLGDFVVRVRPKSQRGCSPNQRGGMLWIMW